MKSRFSAVAYLICYPVLWFVYLIFFFMSLVDYGVIYSNIRYEVNEKERVSGSLVEEANLCSSLCKFYMSGIVGVGVILAIWQILTGKVMIRGWLG